MHKYRSFADGVANGSIRPKMPVRSGVIGQEGQQFDRRRSRPGGAADPAPRRARAQVDRRKSRKRNVTPLPHVRSHERVAALLVSCAAFSSYAM